MFDEIRDNLINFITSRLTLLTLLIMLLGGVLIYRCFELQIVEGETYLNDFVLSTEKTRDIASARGNIMDRNGYVLAYNELAYSVKIEDVYENSNKNSKMNSTIYRLIKLIEKNGDKVITDFKIIVDEDGEFAFTSEGAAQTRFLADVFDHTQVGDDVLTAKEAASTPLEVME
ncbi:MAG: penicillin-binding protein, partial [Acetatifactor sp.]|nr:penicillin-binding protein [Acetatifactor sp.]